MPSRTLLQARHSACWLLLAAVALTTGCGERPTPIDSLELRLTDALLRQEFEEAEQLFERGLDLNKIIVLDRVRRYCRPPLMFAAEVSCERCIEWLIERGADPNVAAADCDQYDRGRTAVEVTAANDIARREDLELMLSGPIPVRTEVLERALEHLRERKQRGWDICEECGTLIRRELQRRQATGDPARAAER